MLREAMQRLIWRFDPEAGRAFFETRQFAWAKNLEVGWEKIRNELNQVMVQRSQIPNFQDLSEDQKALTQGDEWKTFVLYVYGHEVEENCLRCPETVRLLRTIPGMKTALFSILAPGKHIPEHCGPYKGVLRYHLGLVIPAGGGCRIRVKDEIHPWAEGKSLIFDDSHPHEAWNDSSSHRVVLFVDFVRPLPFPLSILNRLMILRFSGRPFITGIAERARRLRLPVEPAQNAHVQ
jgi:beta-hydroxylase